MFGHGEGVGHRKQSLQEEPLLQAMHSKRGHGMEEGVRLKRHTEHRLGDPCTDWVTHAQIAFMR